MSNKRVLTKGMLDEMTKRVSEIEATMALCDLRFDLDVVENLDRELAAICEALTESLENFREEQIIKRRGISCLKGQQ